MNQTFPVEAIIFNRYDFRESDSKINVYALSHGRLDLTVRGTKKPKSKLAGHIEPISKVKLMVVKGKRHYYAGSAKTVDVFSNIKNNYDLLSDCGQAMRIIKTLIKPIEVDNRIYYLLERYLQTANIKDNSKDKSTLLLFFFILKLISYLGYAPQIDSCLSCGDTKKNKKLFFNYKEGGLVCESCRTRDTANILISDKTIYLISYILKNEIDKVDNLEPHYNQITELRKILDMYLCYNLRYKM